jgi:hypothetical protein
MAIQKLNLTRDQLSSFLQNFEQVKQFENLFSTVDAIGVTAADANYVYAGPPAGSPATPAFRPLVVADIPALPYVTSVAALTLGTTGTDLSSTVVNGTTTPVITLNVPTASATNRGVLSAANWTTFNSKAPGVTFTTNYIPYGQGTTTLNQSAGLQFDGTNFTTTGYATATSFRPSSSTVPTNGLYLPATNSVGLATNSTERVRIDASGNVGVGVTPSAWATSEAMQFSGGFTYGKRGFGQNLYFDGTNYKAIATAASSLMQMGSGGFNWYKGASTTAGSNVTLTDAMALDVSGNLAIGTSTPTGKLTVVTTSSAGSSIGSWNSAYAVVSPNAGSGNGAGLGLAYNTSADAAEIAAIAPGVAWKPLYLYSGGLFFYSANGGSTGSLDTSGNLTITGATATKASGTTWANPSDIRLKDNVTDYSKGLAELMQVNVKEWQYNGKGGTAEGMKGLGVIADEIMSVLPNTVDNYQAKLNADDETETDIKKFDATEITWLMLNSIKEQQALITELTSRLTALENSAK